MKLRPLHRELKTGKFVIDAKAKLKTCTYQFNQPTLSDRWIVEFSEPFDKMILQVYSGRVRAIPEIRRLSDSKVELVFAQPISGIVNILAHTRTHGDCPSLLAPSLTVTPTPVVTATNTPTPTFTPTIAVSSSAMVTPTPTTTESL